MQPSEFWKLTPFAFHLLIKSRNDDLNRDFDNLKYLSWHIAAFTRAKKMPKYKEFMRPLKKSQEKGINEADIKTRLKAYQNGKSSKSKR